VRGQAQKQQEARKRRAEKREVQLARIQAMLEGLNAEQRAAARPRRRACAPPVIAGPGSGNARVLTARGGTPQYLNCGVPPLPGHECAIPAPHAAPASHTHA